MPFNLLLANIRLLWSLFFYFALFLIIFFTIPIVIENAKLKDALDIATGAPITVANDVINIPPLAGDKIIKDLSK